MTPGIDVMSQVNLCVRARIRPCVSVTFATWPKRPLRPSSITPAPPTLIGIAPIIHDNGKKT